MEEIERIINEMLVKTYERETVGRREKEEKAEREKREENIKTREEKEREKKKMTENEKEEKSFLDTINLDAFRNDDPGEGKEPGKQTIKKLQKGIDGPTAKLINIKIKVFIFEEKIRRVREGKTMWYEDEKERAAKLGDFHPKLKILMTKQKWKK